MLHYCYGNDFSGFEHLSHQTLFITKHGSDKWMDGFGMARRSDGALTHKPTEE